MIVLRESYANIGDTRLKGDVIKDNAKTVWMNFYPTQEQMQKARDMRYTLLPIMYIKRHIKKHKVNRFV